QISVTCCLLAAALASPQGRRYLPAAGGYGGRNANSIVQASALPRRFSVSKPASSQYGGSGGQSQYGGGQSKYGSGQSQYGGGQSQYGGGQSQYGGGQSQYGGGQSQYGGGNKYGGGNQYGGGASQYGSQDAYAEPANYDFSYEVNAPEYNVQFGHQESRQDMLARGSYRVLLPDGRTQVVEYEADQEGYRPTVTYQEAAGGRGGYGQGGYGGGTSGANGQGGYGGGGNRGNGQGGYGGGANGGNGYGQSNGGYGSKGNAGKASYGQKNAYGSAVVTGGYKVSEQNQGYNKY
ncbi:pro-resilin-like, partial [Homalodisca vitripennis]|uniref:pro-resilin-like n=1 Tax=Homalodisca vitripennis TaxID=197043 RepID=UPI001EEAE2D0